MRETPKGETADVKVGSESILIVDDQPANIAVLTQALAGMNLRVLTANEGATALKTIDSEAVDLVLLDAMMPGMSGFEVARAIRERRSDELLPILMVTALDSVEDLERAFAAGANDFVRKPVSIPEVRARVASFLRMRRQERELAQAVRAARTLEEFRGDLAQLLVHDLKGPLAAIRVLASLIREELQRAPEAVPADLAAIEQTCDKLGAMVLGLIDISRLEQAAMPLVLKPLDLGAIANECLRTARVHAASRRIVLESSGHAPVSGDAALLARVVGNLVENAVSHTPDGGAVMVYAGGDSSGRRTLRVTNTGSTLSNEERARVFDKYRRKDDGTRGTGHRGLGLYFCHLAVTAHGGTIAVEGPEQGPITFVVTLRAPPGEMPATASAPPA